MMKCGCGNEMTKAEWKNQWVCKKCGRTKQLFKETNADRIRAMSDEELSKFLCCFRSCDFENHPCNGCKGEPFCRAGHNGMIDWLRQPEEDFE